MADYSRSASVTLVAGTSGYGKNTLVYRYLVNAATAQALNPEPAVAIFNFEWKGECEQRMGIPAVTTEAGCEAALARRFVNFNPHVMFPGDKKISDPYGDRVVNDAKQGLRWFAQWVWNVSQWGPGRKILFVDELAEFGNKFSVMPEINRIVRNGRFHGLQLVIATQYPRDYHTDIRAGVTEWILFNCAEPDDLDKIRPYWRGVDVLPSLARGEFIAVNRDGGATMRGTIF